MTKNFADMTAAEQSVTIARRAASDVNRLRAELAKADTMDPETETLARALANSVRHLEGCIAQAGMNGQHEAVSHLREIAEAGDADAREYVLG